MRNRFPGRFVPSIALLALAMALPAHAEILDLSLGDNSARAALNGPLSRLASDLGGQYDIGLLVRPRTDEDYLQVHAGALITGDAGARSMELAAGLGARLLYIGIDDDSGGALALGGQFEARLPDFNRLGLTGQVYFAPEVTAFGEVDEYLELAAAVDYQVIRDAAIYVGYRNVNVDLREANNITAENGFRFGMRFTF